MYSNVEKEIVKMNRKNFYNEGLYVINNILVKNGDEISFSDLKKIFRSNKLLRNMYYNISNVGSGRCMSYDFYDFSDRFVINVYGMINCKLGIDLNIIKKDNGRLFLIKESFSKLRDDGYEMYKDESLGIFRYKRKFFRDWEEVC